MKKEEFIKRYGEEAYEKMLEQRRAWREEHPDKVREQQRIWNEAHPDKVLANSYEKSRKGGKYYDKIVIYERTGLRGERNIIRKSHRKQWSPFKEIIAPESQLHHQWCPETAEYTGLALVEADAHMHGVIDVIRILDGEITLFTEKKIREQETKNMRE